MYSDWLWRWDQVLYDSQFKMWSRSPPEDIVIIAIDDASLTELGRWPWSRSVHADLVRRLTGAGVRAIVFDILFSEADDRDRQGDKELIDAVANSGRVVLPVLIEHYSLGRQLVETLPMPALADAASALGHVHIDLDPDGIARRAHLLEGIGTAYWPALSIALLRMIEPGKWQTLPGIRGNAGKAALSDSIIRDHQILIPFTGPPGHYQQISYWEVLNDKVKGSSLRDKIALIGVTATGLGDDLPTPVSGRSQPMPGIEINANLIDALRRGAVLEELSLHWRMMLTGLLLLLIYLRFPRMPPRFVLLATGGMILFTLLLSFLLLHGFQIWFAPTAVLIGLLLGYPLWSWRRLEHTTRYFEQELARLHSEPKSIPFYSKSLQLPQSLEFFRSILPLDGWLLRDHKGRVIESRGELPSEPGQQVHSDNWLQQNNSLWISIPHQPEVWYLGLCRKGPEELSDSAKLLLKEFIEQYRPSPRLDPRNTAEFIENQILRIQAAIAELRTMRGFISDTLRQMLDGLLVINSVGQILLTNNQAKSLLGCAEGEDLKGTDALKLMEKLEIQDGIGWIKAFRDVLLEQKVVFMEARCLPDQELLIQISPLSIEKGSLHGMILLLSDISLLKQSERKRHEALHFLSHDLRSPITSLLSLVQMRNQEFSPFDPEKITERMEHYAKKALQLAEDFLQMARAENANQMNFRETDLVTIAHNAVDEAYLDAERMGIKLMRHMEVDEAWIRADPGLLERALMNLLKNAIYYSGEGSIVKLSISVNKTEVSCCIQDSGQGIAPEELDRIFEPFQRVQDNDPTRPRGTGIGLAFVKVVASKHQGSIKVKSTPGKGSLFCLKLPRGSNREPSSQVEDSCT